MKKYILVKDNIVLKVFRGETKPKDTLEVPTSSTYQKGEDVREYVDGVKLTPNKDLLKKLKEKFEDAVIILDGDTLHYSDSLSQSDVDVVAMELKKETYRELAQLLYKQSINSAKALILGYEPTKEDIEGLEVKMLLASCIAGRNPTKLQDLVHERGQSEEVILASMRNELATYYTEHKREQGKNSIKTLDAYATYIVNTGAWWKVTNGVFYRLATNVRSRILQEIERENFAYVDSMFMFSKTIKAEGNNKQEMVEDLVSKVEAKLGEV